MLSPKTIEDLYNRYSRELMVYLYRLTGSQETSEDLLHDTFIQFISYNKKVNNKRAFLYRTAHNLAINLLKKAENRLTVNIEIEIDKKIVINDTQHQLEEEEMRQEIEAVLNLADPEIRSMFIMKKENCMAYHEISEATGKSERTVRRNITRLTEQIISHLEKKNML